MKISFLQANKIEVLSKQPYGTVVKLLGFDDDSVELAEGAERDSDVCLVAYSPHGVCDRMAVSLRNPQSTWTGGDPSVIVLGTLKVED